jgi:hypothetical protein
VDGCYGTVDYLLRADLPDAASLDRLTTDRRPTKRTGTSTWGIGQGNPWRQPERHCPFRGKRAHQDDGGICHT